MSEEKFVPYSSPIPIAGTSYAAQIGKENESDTAWIVRLIKGKQVMDKESFSELNGNLMIAFIMRATAIPMLNPYKISQNIKMLIKQAERGQPLTAKPTAAPTTTAGYKPAPEYSGFSGSGSTTVPSTTNAQIPTAAAPGQGCPRCGSAIQGDFFYCPYCSLQLKRLTCPGCSKDVRADYKMCPYCGIQLK
ncbi:MAG: double zinc ribbon domain-containing protein [Candidatus Helarchaeota archaeon]